MTDRLDDLERRVAHLEGLVEQRSTGPSVVTEQTFWALEGLRSQAPEGGAVLFTGLVDLPDGRHYEWQQARPAGAVLAGDLDAAAGSLAALGSPVRLGLLRAVLDGADTAAALAELDGTGTTGRVYHHVRILTAAGWLRRGADGRYGVPAERVIPLLVVLDGALP